MGMKINFTFIIGNIYFFRRIEDQILSLYFFFGCAFPSLGDVIKTKNHVL